MQAEKYLRAASLRNKQSFKSFEQLTETYTLLAEISSQQEKTDYLNKALEAVTLAVERYPGSGELRYKFAEIAEQLGKTDLAIRQYEKTVEIEDSYRAQFRIMFPEHPNIVSRLGEEKYQFATERMKALKKQQKQD